MMLWQDVLDLELNDERDIGEVIASMRKCRCLIGVFGCLTMTLSL